MTIGIQSDHYPNKPLDAIRKIRWVVSIRVTRDFVQAFSEYSIRNAGTTQDFEIGRLLD